MEAPRDIENVSLGVLPFVGLMRNTSGSLVENAARRALRDAGANAALLTSAILDFAELGQGLEFTRAVQQRLRAGRIFMESLQETIQSELTKAREEA
jgi:hypothetical protein